MKIVICKECGYSYDDGRIPGEYYCPVCEKERFFFKLEAFCGAIPGELYNSD